MEGFFSAPRKIWTWKDRFKTLEFIIQYAKNLNTYFYCPKDEPHITKNWDKLYTKKYLTQLQKFIFICKKKKVQFVYGLNPDIDCDSNLKLTRNKIQNKINQILKVGCKNICLLFDDVPMAYDVVDHQIKFDNFYKQIVNLINDIYLTNKNKLSDFWICSPDYCFKKETELTKALKNLNKNIKIIWTGNKIFSKIITKKDLRRVKKILDDKKIIYWSNYPVNDCEQAVNTYNLGGFYPIKSNVAAQLSGIVVNPMRECFANLPFYITFSNFLRQTRYNRRLAWKKALKKILKIDKQTFWIINKFSSSNFIDNKKPNDVNKILKKLNEISWENIFNLDKNNELKYLFSKTIQNVIQDAKNFSNIYNSLKKWPKLDEYTLNNFDWFPTRITEVKFIKEISRILKTKFLLYGKEKIFLKKFKFLIRAVNNFEKKYPGGKKLNVTQQDTIKYKKVIKKGVNWERKMLINFINQYKIPLNKKINLIYRRKFINRFNSS